MTSPQNSDTFQASFCAQRLKALGEPLRLRIVDLLCYGELSVGDISEFLETQTVNVSHHLQILKHAGLVTTRREGRFIYYKLSDDLLSSRRRSRRRLNLGCCTIEVPENPETEVT